MQVNIEIKRFVQENVKFAYKQYINIFAADSDLNLCRTFELNFYSKQFLITPYLVLSCFAMSDLQL